MISQKMKKPSEIFEAIHVIKQVLADFNIEKYEALGEIEESLV